MHARSIRSVSRHRVALALQSVLLLATPQVATAAATERGPRAARAAVNCAAAMPIALPNARVTAVRAVQPNDSLRALGRRPYCRVEATVDVETHIVALLPVDWNGRFLMGGGGGYVGAVDNQFAATVHEGFATVGTDAGHSANSLTAGWALKNDERVTDFAYRAVHRSAEVTKRLIAAYNFLAITTTFVRNLQAQYPTGDMNAPVVTPAVLTLLAAKVTEKCDATDGVRDGTLENPETCAFTLASLPACANNTAADGCVTRAQRAALSTFTRPLTAGAVRYPGQPFGDESDEEGWSRWLTGPVPQLLAATGGTIPTAQAAFGTELFKYFIYGDSAWRYIGYNLARAARDGAKVDAIVSATNPDLSAFRARGGKLLLAHGWSDPALNARSTIEYFNAVQARTPQASSFTRLFMMPGVLHCAGGSGCDQVDWAGIIRRWVEQGEAPSRIVARKERDTKAVRTHPLCAYPMTARYNGTGRTDDAAAFTCR